MKTYKFASQSRSRGGSPALCIVSQCGHELWYGEVAPTALEYWYIKTILMALFTSLYLAIIESCLRPLFADPVVRIVGG